MTDIKAPMNYIGNKYKIIHQIRAYFPENINHMVDLFCGGCDVTFNTPAKRHTANDMNFFVIGIYKEFQKTGIPEAIAYIDETIRKWNLTKQDKDAYLRFREYYNKTKNPLDLYVLMCYSFNYQFRFNSKHEYNNPFGKDRSSFNNKMRENLYRLTDIINSITFTTTDFRDFDCSELTPNDFVYADPPYLLTCGSYNDGKRGFKGWTEQDEQDLYDVLDKLNKNGIPFALSNVAQHKGNVHTQLLDWQEKNGYRIHKINKNYDNCNYHTKNKTYETREILITNY